MKKKILIHVCSFTIKYDILTSHMTTSDLIRCIIVFYHQVGGEFISDVVRVSGRHGSTYRADLNRRIWEIRNKTAQEI